jgi:hypothetical protein
MMMSADEIQRLDATSAQVRTATRRGELQALVDRLRNHIDRVGATPGIADAYDRARTELATLEQEGTP